MDNQRAGDTGSGLHYRSDRISTINGEFFFATREDTLEGPFSSREEALVGVQKYIESLTSSEPQKA